MPLPTMGCSTSFVLNSSPRWCAETAMDTAAAMGLPEDLWEKSFFRTSKSMNKVCCE